MVSNLKDGEVTNELPDGRYKLISVANKGSLYAGEGLHDDGDRYTWVGPKANYKDERDVWVIEHVGSAYYVRSAKHGGPLFGEVRTDEYGDHRAWMSPNNCYDIEKQLWEIKYARNGTYKLFNVKWRGPLFCRTGYADDGDQEVCIWT